VLLGQAPLIGALVALAYDAASPAGRAEAAFKLSLSAIWLGCVAGCQELVKERPIYQRERLAGLSRTAYLASKTILVAALTLAQAAALVAVAYSFQPLQGEPLLLLATLFPAAFASAGLGLLISAAASSRTSAVALTPVVLVPQVLFVGTVVPLRGLAAAIGRLLPSYWANEAATRVVSGGAALAPIDVAPFLLYAAGFLAATMAVLCLRDARERGER
jgi:ABC-type multidrug transport system permease subunit